MALGDYLRSLRLKRGLQQKQLAIELGIRAPYISNLEKGSRVYLGEQMLNRLRQVMDLTDEEVARIRELREIANGHISIPPHASEEEAALMRTVAKCVGRMPASQVRAVRNHLESWLQMIGTEPAHLSDQEKRIA